MNFLIKATNRCQIAGHDLKPGQTLTVSLDELAYHLGMKADEARQRFFSFNALNVTQLNKAIRPFIVVVQYDKCTHREAIDQLLNSFNCDLNPGGYEEIYGIDEHDIGRATTAIININKFYKTKKY